MNHKEKTDSIDLSKLRARLQSKEGQTYWRSLEELAETEEFRRWVQNEFPATPFDGGKGLSRRRFLQLMGASMALAGLNACTRQPKEKIIPHVTAPEEIVPGQPLFFATSVMLGGYAVGVLAESHDGRPTKIEGNPDHPASLGATDIFAQASILGLYDPDRSKAVKHRGRISTWERFLGELLTELEGQRVKDGAGIRILTETVTSPTLANQIQGFLAEFPLAKWHQYEAVGRDHFKRGARMAFGEFVDCRYDLEKADVILCLDGDFLSQMPGSLAYARQFAKRRQVGHGHNKMNRLYAVESSPSLVGTMADHRLSMRAAEVVAFAATVARKLGVYVNARGGQFQQHAGWIDALVRDLKRHAGRNLVIAGEQQAPEVHYLAHAINFALGNVGKTVVYTQSVEAKPVLQTDSLRELAGEMVAGTVDLLVILGGNPVFDAPADLNFADSMSKVKTRVHLGLYEDETAELCHWHIPQSHSLESWSDARAFDGTASIVQPLIAPLYASKTVHELVAALSNQTGKSPHDLVRETWQVHHQNGNFDKFWRIALHDGLIAGTRFSAKKVALKMPKLDARSAASSGIELIFRPDPHVWDGRFANNGWLQELSKPLTKLTWDNAALLSPRLAEKLDLHNEEVVEITHDGRFLQAPVWITPGHAQDSVTLYLGYGRRKTGHVGKNCGVDAAALRTCDTFWSVEGVEIRKTDKTVRLACTQDHSSMEGRHLVRAGTLKDYLNHPEMFHELGHDPEPSMSLYPPYEYNGYAWGMVVDLNTCIGCNACTIACQSENNISVVGKEEVLNGREMYWIRIDRYYEGDLDNPDTYHQPVMCMHCENAPCEVVCPVAATTHSDEGLNEMTYNRCVGTRYCANNCPYKVRRFNFYKYADYETESLKLMRNPDVTVRFRGVMEKCSYCVQRINLARIAAKKEDRQVRDGDILTACQQVCPTDAIVFGDINDPDSRVSKLKAEHRNYGLLTELGTRPRTSYLAKINNPNPEILES
ncbi:MAG: TAT-variant-translocated molybdopterin oxidoreductase [bacterium]